MAVTYSRSGNTLTVTITESVADLVANTRATRQDRIVTALGRCDEQLRAMIESVSGTQTIDDQIAALQARKAALPTPPANF